MCSRVWGHQVKGRTLLVVRPLSTTAVWLQSSSTGPPSDGSGGDNGNGDKDAQKNKNEKNQLCCPKCGDPCIHVETFVCKFLAHFYCYLTNTYIKLLKPMLKNYTL